MYEEISSFIDSSIKLKIGFDEWNKFKKNEYNPDSKLIIVTSKSCRKFISGINNEIIIIVKDEPSLDLIDNYFERISKKISNLDDKNINFIALGGGSVIDTAKIICLMIGNKIKTSKDAIDRSSSEKLVENNKIICIPTTAGTGAEITPFSTIWDKERGIKHSIVAEKISRSIIIDAKLTLSLPKKIIISSSIDCLCQILESTWSKNLNHLSLKSATKGFRYLIKNINSILKNVNNIQAREEMLVASLFGGISISIANTTLCHSISYPLTAKLNISHGLACGFTLIEVIKFNSKLNDEFLKNTLKITGYKTSEILVEKINEVLKNIEFNDLIKPHLNDIENNLNNILPLTLNKRSSNNPVKANLNEVEMIINKSLIRYK